MRVVEVLEQVNQTSKDIKLSNEYADVSINKQLGRKRDEPEYGRFGPSFMGDDVMVEEAYQDDERAI